MSNRPKPPDHLSVRAAEEWHRMVDELDDAGRLDAADRSVLTLYCEAWAVYNDMMVHVREHGAIVQFSNGVAGQSPHYKTSRECANFMRGLLSDLGLTPITRSKVKSGDKPVEPLTF